MGVAMKDPCENSAENEPEEEVKAAAGDFSEIAEAEKGSVADSDSDFETEGVPGRGSGLTYLEGCWAGVSERGVSFSLGYPWNSGGRFMSVLSMPIGTRSSTIKNTFPERLLSTSPNKL